MLRKMFTNRGRRLAAALAAAVPLVLTATPAHAALQSEFAMPWPVCDWSIGACTARTAVHVVLASDYAFCVAQLTASEELASPPKPASPRLDASLPTIVDIHQLDMCGYPGVQDAMLEAWVQWVPGSCISTIHPNADDHAMAPVWNAGAFIDHSAAPTCSTVDTAFTQTFSFGGCPGTSFTLTAEVKGFSDGTYSSSYNVSGTGACASQFDIIAVEGARGMPPEVLPNCTICATGAHASGTSPAAAPSSAAPSSPGDGVRVNAARRIDSAWSAPRCLPSSACLQ